MAEFHIRGIDGKILAKYKDQAKTRNMSVNKYIIGVLTNYALSPEVKGIDSRYQELVKVVLDSLEANSEILHENTEKIHELTRTLQGEKNV